MDLEPQSNRLSSSSSSSSSFTVVASWLTAALIGASIGLYYYYKNAHSFWQRRGLKGPKAWPFVGNFLQLMGKDRRRLVCEWSKQYGKVYGAYRGSRPELIVADAEVLQQICIKDFDVFTNHSTNEFFNHYQKSFLFFLQDEHWKRVRALMSPTFTSGKIKRMFQLLDACADDLIDCFQEQFAPATERTLVNVNDIYHLYTMDAISTCCYGLKLERADSSDLGTAVKRNSFVKMASALFDFSTWRLLLSMSGPNPLLRLVGFQACPTGPFDRLVQVMRQLVDRRRKSSDGKKLDDYLQLLIDAKLDDKIELGEMDSAEDHHAGLSRETLVADQERMLQQVSRKEAAGGRAARQVLSEHEIVTGAMFLLVVGLETTATLLTNCSCLLSFHPEVQEKLHQELEEMVEFKAHAADNKGKSYFSYEAITSCQYLDAVVSESLRLFGPALQTDRLAGRDYRLEKYNLDIPKGCLVTTSFAAIMQDPDYWPEPQKFDPERFMPANREKIVPGSYCPFGIGPRHCIGMRFSLTEAKLALAKTVIKYRFEPSPEAEFPLQLTAKFASNTVKCPSVYLIPRVANASH